jgi:hypothetical protein
VGVEPAEGVVAFAAVAGREQDVEGVRERPRVEEIVDEAAAEGEAEATRWGRSILVGFLLQFAAADLLAPVTRTVKVVVGSSAAEWVDAIAGGESGMRGLRMCRKDR